MNQTTNLASIPLDMTLIEQHYLESISQMSAQQRVARSVEMFNWAREFIGRQILLEQPETSPQRLKLLVALRMYGGEPAIRRMLEGLLKHVSD